MRRRVLGTTGLSITEVCVGTSPLGSMPGAYGYEADESAAFQAVSEVFDSTVNFLDTSNEYSDGESERRIGHVIRERGGLPDGFVLATKVDPRRGASTLPGERVRESFAESTERLGVDYIPLLYLHDPVRFPVEEMTRPGGAIDVMLELKEAGLVGHIGVADGDLHCLRQLVDTGSFDVVLNHNLYTLIDRTADSFIDYAVANGLAFVNAAPFGGGILVKGPEEQPRYAYRKADEPALARVRAMQEVCHAPGVDLATAALQFSTRDQRVSSTVVGISQPGRVAALVQRVEAPVPDELWADLDAIHEEGGAAR